MPALPTTSAELAAELRAARERTLALVADLRTEQWLGPRLEIVNPPLWELGHVAWFQEHWVLRHALGRAPLLPQGDLLYDSARVAHGRRWDLALPAPERTAEYLERVLSAVLEEVQRAQPAGALLYFLRLVLFHEDMHAEALHYARQTLGYPRPPGLDGELPVPDATLSQRELELPGGAVEIGSPRTTTFVFDNQKWAHAQRLEPFRLAAAPVNEGQWLEFVEAGGYRREAWWSPQGWSWRARAASDQPVYWRRQAGGNWLKRVYDRWLPLEPGAPMLHVNWHEAQAWCRFAGRRLPSELEWEAAAQALALPGTGSAPLPGTGSAWEWTESAFLPYPGFSPDPYQEYSQPWFGTHRVLRGASRSTPARLRFPEFRNFYLPERRDLFAGLRAAL